MPLLDEIDRKRRDIIVDAYPMSIGEMLNLYKDGEIDVHPEFQRFYRWDDEQKSNLIESILLGIPIPPYSSLKLYPENGMLLMGNKGYLPFCSLLIY